MDRARLIDRKHEVIAALAALRRRIEHERTKDDTRLARRRIARMEAEADRLAGEEQRLRAAIDRAPR